MIAPSKVPTLPYGIPATSPQLGCGSVAQPELPWRVTVGDVADHIDPINRCVQGVVDAHMGGVVAFAALVEQPVPTVSRRLRRADDGKGQRMELPTLYLAAIWTDPVARVALVDALCALAGRKPSEAIVTMSDSDKLRIVAGALSERSRRQLEREHCLPRGSLGS